MSLLSTGEYVRAMENMVSFGNLIRILHIGNRLFDRAKIKGHAQVTWRYRVSLSRLAVVCLSMDCINSVIQIDPDSSE